MTDVANLITKNDRFNSDWRTRENFKYSSSVGISGTPSALVNGVKVDSFPSDIDELKDFLKDIYPG